MARKRERAFAAFGAILFLITSSALTIGVVVSLIQQHNQKPASNAASTASSSSTTKQSQGNKTVDNSKKLQGTQLANFTPVPSISQLQEIDTTPGTGDTVKSGATVTVDYTGAVASTGVIFQSSKDMGQTATFPLSQVIAGWSQGIPGMKVGGTRRLLIPANLAYGANPPQGSGIPANADLVFDVTLHSIGK
ncbi:MAG TPA: FKBP-type peptidyl-prolyl cis-trans isomerase [Candidatus Dormibacteraeota bacterium]|nr:FKBP-type peptidyl-prolyl cis-trans isomerase [Candidatus Dormibacteraeota bacterium]